MSNYRRISDLIASRNNYRSDFPQHRSYLKITREQYDLEFKKSFAEITSLRHESAEFELHEDQRELYENLFLYVTGSDKCKWELQKGLYLFGKIGYGKTIFLLAVCDLFFKFAMRKIEIITARDYDNELRVKGLQFYRKRPVFIDDIVKETLENQNLKWAFIKSVEMWYNSGAWVFLTSNYNQESVKNTYGEMTLSRLVSIVNFIEVRGTSKRK